jgi:hypothetical protein
VLSVARPAATGRWGFLLLGAVLGAVACGTALWYLGSFNF